MLLAHHVRVSSFLPGLLGETLVSFWVLILDIAAPAANAPVEQHLVREDAIRISPSLCFAQFLLSLLLLYVFTFSIARYCLLFLLLRSLILLSDSRFC